MSAELVEKILANGRERARIDLEFQSMKQDLEDRARTEIRNFKGLKAFISVTYANVSFYIQSLNEVEFMDGGGWGVTDPTDEYGFGSPAENGPMPWDDFAAKVKDLSERLGVRVTYVTLKQRTEGGIENVAALRLLHPGKTVTQTARGQVRYVGWDIGDDWYEATIGEDAWAFWGEDAHGGGIVRSAMKGSPEWSEYEAFRASGD